VVRELYAHHRNALHQLILASALSTTALFFVPLARADDFALACTLPFHQDTSAQPIDNKCDAGGTTQDGPKGLQNRQKNNLCATGPAVTLSMADFMSLQRQAKALGVAFGASNAGGQHTENLPDDRSTLQSGPLHTVAGSAIHEGDKVQIVAYMIEPHPSDVPSGEDVNCGYGSSNRARHQEGQAAAIADNDVHMNLAMVSSIEPAPGRNDPDKASKLATRNAALCKTIVAEVIPHYRPSSLRADALASIASQGKPVRVMGQLFFDASHYPCTGSTSHGPPVRGSLWEVHPIYSLDVCRHTELTSCAADDDSVWTPVEMVEQ
jgi:hypothetical protein